MSTQSVEPSTEIAFSAADPSGEASANGQAIPRVYEIITARVLDLLAGGTVPWRKPWRAAGHNPRSLRSGRPYRGINVFLLNCAPFGSAYWLTFKQAIELGGNVRKGAKGSPVVLWKWVERRDAEDSEEVRRYPLLRYYTVFNIEQCEGITPPAEIAFSPIERCERVASSMSSAPIIEHNAGGKAAYSPSRDLVSIPRPGLFESPESYYATLFHELGHATGHGTRLAGEGITDATMFGDHRYSREELVAEMTAAFLCGQCGIEQATIANSAAYVANWLQRLRNDKRLVVTAAAQAQRAADFVLGVSFSTGLEDAAESEPA